MAKKLEHKLEKAGSKGEGQMQEGEVEVDDTSSTEAVVGAPQKETHFVEAVQEQPEHRSHHHGDRIPGWHRHELTPMQEVETRDER